jgi:hypothetical protein
MIVLFTVLRSILELGMTMTITIATLIFLGLAAGFSLVFARLTAKDRLSSQPDDLQAIFSPTRYKVMERLLGDADEDFVRSHIRRDSPIQRNFRTVRLQIFRGYLHQLSNDFDSVAKALKMLMVSSRADRPDLAGLLMKQQFSFTVAYLRIEFNLVLYRLGWAAVDLQALMQPLNAVREQLQSFAVMDPVAVASRA